MGCGASTSQQSTVQQAPSSQTVTRSCSVQQEMSSSQQQGGNKCKGLSNGCAEGSGCSGKESCSELLEDTAALKLRLLLQQLDRGQVPQISELKKIVTFASEALACKHEAETGQSEEERLECVRDRQVREWLSVTFTRVDSVYENHPVSVTPIVRFKAAANTIIISHYLGNISPRDMTLQPVQQVSDYLEKHIDDWDFDMFEMERLCDGNPFRYVAQHLLKKHNLFEKCEISTSRFGSFLVKIEEGYNHHGNPYHNACHGADVAQTVHYFLQATGVKAVLTDIEVLSVLLAALVHDVHHPGTTNGFQINQNSEYALLYNDRSVLENHHLYYTFKSLQESDSNFLKNLSSEDYKLVRGLVIEMVLATDMSSHFEQLKHMRHVLSLPEAVAHLQGAERGKAFSLLLHMADISHPGKPWPLHLQWSHRIAEEYYKQGDQERKQGLPLSPLCDRDTGNLATSQIGFIEHIVSPSYELCGDLLEMMLATPCYKRAGREGSPDSQQVAHDPSSFRIWEGHLASNTCQWREKERPNSTKSGGSQSSREPSTRPTTDTTNATNGTDNAAANDTDNTLNGE